jgi:hypothetical protein
MQYFLTNKLRVEVLHFACVEHVGAGRTDQEKRESGRERRKRGKRKRLREQKEREREKERENWLVSVLGLW